MLGRSGLASLVFGVVMVALEVYVDVAGPDVEGNG